MTKRLAIIWFSRTGGSEAMARAACDAAHDEPQCETVLIEASKAGADDLVSRDGYLFVFPENLAAIAGGMKEFFDRSYYDVLGQIQGRPYAAMICAGSDGENAQRQVERIATGWRLRKIADTLIVCTHAQSSDAILAPKTIGQDDLAKCREIGASLATGLVMGVF